DVRLAGLDALLRDIADLIDRAKNPEAYASLQVGNEILIVGPSLSGKKALAYKIAKEAGMNRLIVVYNARNADALAKAKSLIQHYRRQKVMLLLPRLATVTDDDEEVLAELEALVDTSTTMRNVQVVGTAVDFEPSGLLDNLFGIVLTLPGTPVAHAREHALRDDARRLLVDVACFYLAAARDAGFALDGLDDRAVVDRITQAARSPADVEDITVMAQTTALYRQRKGLTKTPQITSDILERSIRRVIVTPT